MKGETEGKILADQDHAISKNYFKNNMFKEDIDIKCRLCKHHEKTMII
jgi:hypothetical protein